MRRRIHERKRIHIYMVCMYTHTYVGMFRSYMMRRIHVRRRIHVCMYTHTYVGMFHTIYQFRLGRFTTIYELNYAN